MNYGVLRALRGVSHIEDYPVLYSGLANYKSWNTEHHIETGAVERLRRVYNESSNVVEYDDLGKGSVRTGGDRNTQRVRRVVSEISKSSAPVHQCQLMYCLTSAKKPRTVLELGTCLGISAGYIGLALQNTETGRLYSIEGADILAQIARETIDQLHLSNTQIRTGSFQSVLPDLLPQIEPIDFVFIDGHHEGDAMTGYFELIEPFLAPDCMVLFDDLSWSRDMRSAWNRIKVHPRIRHSVDLVTVGIGLMR
ncbi:MAG: class I SAM-dependent methyltransferase [Rhodothermales bacterium]|nr:class I SAM-dependent methyltransferase [Rhodothermales bacterium]